MEGGLTTVRLTYDSCTPEQLFRASSVNSILRTVYDVIESESPLLTFRSQDILTSSVKLIEPPTTNVFRCVTT